MNVTVERQDAESDGHEALGEGLSSDSAGLPTLPRILLACWVGANAALVTGLAVWNATLTSAVWDLIGTALLGGIGIICALSAAQLAAGSRSAVLTTVLSQIFLVGLAIYVWMVDQRSPASQLLGVTGVALTLGGLALAWVLYLGRYARGVFGKSATVAVALFPVVGLAQFWMQTEYLPTSARPLIDISAELSPMGSTGPFIHLAAKVTMHNRGSIQADMHAGLVRLTSYPVGQRAQPATVDRLLSALTPEGRSQIGAYRQIPTLPADSSLLYASLFAAPYDDAFLAPGATGEWKRVIDIDSRTVRLVRLSVEGVFASQRTMKDVRTCYPPQVSMSRDPVTFFGDVGKLHDWAGTRARVLCTESQFASTGVIQELVSDHPISRSFVVVDGLSGAVEVPLLMTYYGTRQTIEDPFKHVDTMIKVDRANPAVTITATAEYAPSGTDVHTG